MALSAFSNTAVSQVLFPGQGTSPGLGPGTGTGWGVRAQDAGFFLLSPGAGGRRDFWHAWAAWVGTRFRVSISFRATGVREGFSSALSQDLWLPARNWRGRSVGGSQRRAVGGCECVETRQLDFESDTPPGKSVRVYAASLGTEGFRLRFRACLFTCPSALCVNVGSNRGEGSARDVSRLF